MNRLHRRTARVCGGSANIAGGTAHAFVRTGMQGACDPRVEAEPIVQALAHDGPIDILFNQAGAQYRHRLALDLHDSGCQIRHWVVEAGKVSGCHAGTLFYPPVSAWLTGFAGVAFEAGHGPARA